MKENSPICVSPTPTRIGVVRGYQKSFTTTVQTMNFPTITSKRIASRK